MPVSKSQLVARAVIRSERTADESDSILEAYRKTFAPLGRNLALDILKNSGVQTTALNALKWPNVSAVSVLNDLLKSPAFEAQRALSRLVEPSALEAACRVQQLLGSSQFVEQVSALNSAKILAAQDFVRLSDISRSVSSQLSVLDGSIASAALRRATLFGVRGWESAATAFVQQPDAKRFLPLAALGRGTVGVTAAVTALVPELDDIATDADDD